MFLSFSYGQEEEVLEVIEETVTETVINDAFITPNITDDMTVDAAQNEAWKSGQYKYSAKPKNAWELGIHGGHFFIDGDVDRTLPGGFGLGLHLRKAIHYAFSIRGDLFYGRTKFLDPHAWASPDSNKNGTPNTNGVGGGLVEPVFDAYRLANGGPGHWFPSARTTYIYGAIQGVVNIGNILFHNERNKWNWYVTIGAGLDTHNTQLDLLDANGLPYFDLENRSGFTPDLFDTQAGRNQIRSNLNSIYDGDYESDGFKKAGIFRLGDETNIHPIFTASMGVSRKINKRINIGIEHQVMASDNDYLDGIKFRTALDQTNNADIGHYTNARLAFNLGNFNNITEPLYWLNPLDAAMSDVAALKKRPELDLSDSDNDGVVDMMDQELDTPDGCAVDTRGITLDSDGDGLADCKDKEPYSPPGYQVDSEGVADVPVACCITEDDVNRIVDSKAATLETRIVERAVSAAPATTSTVVSSGCGEWFLPMIHFDSGKSYIKPEFYGQLHHVATVLKMCPEICIVAQGHTDNNNSNDFNNVLSYNRAKSAIDYLTSNYGIDRSRIKLMYGGEDNPLVNGASGAGQDYMNRRVEFRVCDGADFDMGRPAGAAVQSAGTEVRGNQYNGNKNSGY
jgi:outer membrane protein OmpA-like peptidoglycan-associated protein